IKLGSLKPECEPIYWDNFQHIPKEELTAFQQRINQLFPSGVPKPEEPYFQFVKQLSEESERYAVDKGNKPGFSPSIAYPYFALFGDSLLEDSTLSYPDTYLEKMYASGVDSIWMHIVLSKITPFPWDSRISEHWEKRLQNLKKLVDRARKKGIGIYLYLNEPRHQTESFFKKYPDLKGAGNALCTSHLKVQEYLKDSLSLI